MKFNPTGKSPSVGQTRCQALCAKNILIFRRPKSLVYPLLSCPPEGRLEIVTDVGQDAMDAEGAEDEGT
jgi:hypothetical protein